KDMIDLMIKTLLSGGHILLEGVPGLAKSLGVETFARVIGGDFKRFQFTPDKMPGDITGTTIYNEREKKFDQAWGPVFCNIFLADEINRASPKVQSALLEAMQEKKVDMDGVRKNIPELFIVLATQNPIEQVGTYPLAEAQVDRFMVKYQVGYPTQEDETELIVRKNSDFKKRTEDIRQVADIDDILFMQRLIHDTIQVKKNVMDYMINICIATRPLQACECAELTEIHEYLRLGASPRATESLLALSKSHAFCQGRDIVTFDDVSQCAPHVLRHRILLNNVADAKGVSCDMIVDEVLKQVRVY
ncbi:AAA family ATPase, partial [Desulfobacterales bacterium HSG16]|nr:AAA family ATPase [Desulfobacterales bacterium HSG16]